MKEVTRRSLLKALTVSPAAWALGCGSPGIIPDAGAPDTGPGRTDAGPRVDSGQACAPTQADAEGPFYVAGSTQRTRLAEPGEAGDRLLLGGRMLDARDCATPLSGYTLDLWQADVDGNYLSDRLRGRMNTGPDGAFSFETIQPGRYLDLGDYRPSHIHAKVFAPSGLVVLTTQIYFAGDPFLSPNDSCGPPSCFSDDPARIVTLTDGNVNGTPGQLGTFNLILPAT